MCLDIPYPTDPIRLHHGNIEFHDDRAPTTSLSFPLYPVISLGRARYFHSGHLHSARGANFRSNRALHHLAAASNGHHGGYLCSSELPRS